MNLFLVFIKKKYICSIVSSFSILVHKQDSLFFVEKVQDNHMIISLVQEPFCFCLVFLFEIQLKEMELVLCLQCFGSSMTKKQVFFLQLNLKGAGSGPSWPTSAFFDNSLKTVLGSKITNQRLLTRNLKLAAEYDKEKQPSKDKWKGLAFDTSDDQQDITRGKGMVDSLFQAPMGTGTHYAVMSSYDYTSKGLRQ